VLLKAEMLSWSRSRGAFAGLSLEGATLRPDNDENRKLYRREITNKEILQSAVAPPQGTRPFIAILNRYSGGPVTNALVTESLNTTGGRLALREREIHFASGSADIPASAQPVLSAVVNTLKQNASWRLIVEGHTDNVGTKAANQKLSEQRAQAVVGWLVDHGIERNRLTARGFGQARPVADNTSEEGRARNRRVELVRQ